MVDINTPRIGEPETVYQNPYQRVYRVEADFGPFVKQYFVMDTGRRAGIIAVKDDAILLVRQWRLLIRGLSWEIPGGRVDEGEEPQVAAVRECLEETGVQCSNPQPLLFYHRGLDTSYNPTHIFYSEDVSLLGKPQNPHEHEVTDGEWVPLNRCIEMIAQGEIVDCFTIIGLLSYQSLRNRS